MSEQKGAPQLAYGQLGGESRVHVEDDGVHVTDLASVERVTLGRLTGEPEDAAATYGLRVKNGADVVVIDGTSDMFKIVASGTMQATVAAAVPAPQAVTTTTVSLPGLGAQSAIPAFMGLVPSTNTNAGFRFSSVGFLFNSNVLFAAATSGGSPTNTFNPPVVSGQIYTTLNGSTAEVNFTLRSSDTSTGYTWYAKYYILKEAAI